MSGMTTTSSTALLFLLESFAAITLPRVTFLLGLKARKDSLSLKKLP